MEYGPHPALVVRSSKTHGLGVYTREALPAGTVVERCAILESMVRRTPEHPRSAMDRYTFFCWKPYPDIGFMPAGFVSFLVRSLDDIKRQHFHQVRVSRGGVPCVYPVLQ